MNITFFFDPSCPYSWITSRWLLFISNERDINTTWRPFSLALKNNEVYLKSGENKNTFAHQNSHRALRVMLAANKQFDTPLIDLYSASGMIYHILGEPLDDNGLKLMLKNLNLPENLISAADSDLFDKELKSYIDEATKIAGKDIGVPTIIFNLADGSRHGYFGPVLNRLPDMDESLKIWDSLSTLATTPSFFELKRSRKSNMADVASTARC
ncbi:disulfide bond formation protein DsbA [Candidatus Saccharibacteria bacterium]|jgi:hypothetical protein|nr:disulfide bond formation protein DsbA [Candidatus Saccharibacteria bacterium]